MSLEFSDLEEFYESLAKSIDTVTDAEREVFLCKLCLLMAKEMKDLPKAQEMIQSALKHLDKA